MRGTGRIFCVGVEEDGAGAGLAFGDAPFLVPPRGAMDSEDVGCRSWRQHARCTRGTSLPVARSENIQKTSVSVRVGLAQERCFWYLLHAAWILCQEGAEVLTAQQHLSLISDAFPDNAVVSLYTSHFRCSDGILLNVMESNLLPVL